MAINNNFENCSATSTDLIVKPKRVDVNVSKIIGGPEKGRLFKNVREI
jgi:hypothetical protein